MAVKKGAKPRTYQETSFYVAGVDFTCLDGSAKVPFDHINDDYCDCRDGSDEPGTSACPNGSFHCTNAGHAPLNIPSSRVNDGICDCCDGTDEYDSRAKCENTCRELGKAAREEREKMNLLIKEGYQIFKDYSQQGTDAKKERQAELSDLQREKDELEARKNELQSLKEEAELPEKEAKDIHKKQWDEEKAQLQQEKDEKKCEDAFKELDYNGDGSVSVEEMKLHQEFDIDSNGEVTEEEAKLHDESEFRKTADGISYRVKSSSRKEKAAKPKDEEQDKNATKVKNALEYLEDKDGVDLYTFQTEVWPNIKEIYKKAEPRSDGAEEVEEETSQQHLPRSTDPLSDLRVDNEPVNDLDTEHDGEDFYERDDDDNDRYDDEDFEEDEYDEEDEDDDIRPDASTDEEMPEYDENTKILIAAADKARSDFNEAENQFKTAESKLNDLNRFLSLDLGTENEFFPIKDSCYEFTDREYTYKFCPYDKATQRSKSGGGDTSLGHWGRWDGPEGNKYSVMLLENGQGCWNGPNRSVKVHIKCGVNNELIAASEPNRCEYEYQFLSPAACHSMPEEEPRDIHTEL